MKLKKENLKKSSDKKKRLKKKVDRLWFEKYIQPECEVCSKPAQQLHHFFYKQNSPYIRHLKENGISLCKGCHFVLHMQDSKLIEEQIIEKRGKRWLNRLRRGREERPFNYDSIGYYQSIYEQLSNN